MTIFAITILAAALAGQCSCQAAASEFKDADLGQEEQGSAMILLQKAAPVLSMAPLPAGNTIAGNVSAASAAGAGASNATGSFDALRRVKDDMIGVVLAAVDRHVWAYDVFNSNKEVIKAKHTLFNAAPGSEWVVLFLTILVLLLVDLFILQQYKRTKTTNLINLAFWIVCGLAYNVYFLVRYEKQAATDWFIGYLLEWMLSMDNLFVFHLVFNVYKTPERQMHRALFFGIVGAVAFRMVFFVALGSLLYLFDWVRFIFGAVLIWSGVEAARSDGDDDEDIANMYSVRALKWVCGSRLMETYDEQGASFFMRNANGQLCVTMLFFVVLCLELTDILFAVDSVSAKVSQIADQYIAYSSSVIAIFSLRAMFFVIHDLVEIFDLLKYGLCFILVFIGAELMLNKVVALSPSTVCIIILAVFMTCIAGSVAQKKLFVGKAEPKESSEIKADKAVSG